MDCEFFDIKDNPRGWRAELHQIQINRLGLKIFVNEFN
jgi:hypothetical protein